MFNFKSQFKRYEKPFIAIVEGKKGGYDLETGKYIPPSEFQEVEMKGIIAQLGDDELRFGEGGTYTFEDRKILIDTDIYNLRRGQEVIIEGDKYRVMEIAPYSLYSHFKKVIVKRVSTSD